MALCEIRWFSKTIEKMVGTTVVLPDKGKPPFPTFYLLHGLSDDYSSWHRRTRVEWYVRDLPLIVVMPDAFRGFYTNNEQGPQFAKYLGEELVEMIERNFPAKRARSARCIGGLSMGGYGALRLALGYPNTFASVNSHSGAVMHGSRPPQGLFVPEMKRVFGNNPAGSKHDLLVLARKAKSAGKLPKIRLDCGFEDHLIDDNRAFHQRLIEMDIPHDYEEHPGGHNWDYWDWHIRGAIGFHLRNLKIRPIPD